MADINSLPDEVLERIFFFCLQTETQLNFAERVLNVCRKWEWVAVNSSLFVTVGGSLKVIVKLALAGALKNTTTIKFGQIDIDNIGQYKIIYTNSPRLKRLDLSNMYRELHKKENHEIFTELEGLCPDLCEIVLARPDDYFCQATVPAAIFDHILLFRGPNFVKLDFSGALIVQLVKLFLHVANNCPNLEELLAMNFLHHPMLHQFPVEHMQKGLPNLKTLRLGHPIVFTYPSRAVGFPKLEMFTSENNGHLSSSDLEALLYKSHNLKILNIRGCHNLIYKDIHSLPATNLEQIYLCNTRILVTKVSLKLFQKWSRSLNVIDISLMEGELINELFLPVHLPNGLPKLQVLNVTSTGITADTLKIVVRQCPQLRCLSVRGCRRLKSEAWNVYNSRLEIKDLLFRIL